MDSCSVEVAAANLDTIEILKRSILRNDAMRQGNGAYRRSNLEMHDTGLLGEYAVAWWLRQHHDNVVEIADNRHHRRTGSGDVAILRPEVTEDGNVVVADHITFEVKTNRLSSWKRYERTLDLAQLERSTANVYIWCVISDDWPTESVLLAGWLPTSEIRTAEAGRLTVEHNRPHWRVHAPMRPMLDLPNWWSSVPPHYR